MEACLRPPRARGLLATALFAAVFAVRMLTDAAGTGVGFLYVVPIVILAVEFGRTAGLASGLLAVGLFAIWAQLPSRRSRWTPWATSRAQRCSCWSAG